MARMNSSYSFIAHYLGCEFIYDSNGVCINSPIPVFSYNQHDLFGIYNFVLRSTGGSWLLTERSQQQINEITDVINLTRYKPKILQSFLTTLDGERLDQPFLAPDGLYYCHVVVLPHYYGKINVQKSKPRSSVVKFNVPNEPNATYYDLANSVEVDILILGIETKVRPSSACKLQTSLPRKDLLPFGRVNDGIVTTPAKTKKITFVWSHMAEYILTKLYRDIFGPTKKHAEKVRQKAITRPQYLYVYSMANQQLFLGFNYVVAYWFLYTEPMADCERLSYICWERMYDVLKTYASNRHTPFATSKEIYNRRQYQQFNI
jgi:hypothetical protein